jgi:hypothetical protein
MGQQIECRIVVEEKVIWSSSLAANDIGSLNWITTEKYRLYIR